MTRFRNQIVANRMCIQLQNHVRAFLKTVTLLFNPRPSCKYMVLRWLHQSKVLSVVSTVWLMLYMIVADW